MLPTPTQIFAKYERGEIGFAEVNEMMAPHAKGVIEEMEEDYRNPAAALLEYLLTKRASGKLARKHGARLVREAFHAMSEVEGFPPANLLWNALHLDVPLHCFFRIRREPVFRVILHGAERELVDRGDGIWIARQRPGGAQEVPAATESVREAAGGISVARWRGNRSMGVPTMRSLCKSN